MSVLFSQGERPILLIIFTATRCGIRIGYIDLHIFLVWLTGCCLIMLWTNEQPDCQFSALNGANDALFVCLATTPVGVVFSWIGSVTGQGLFIFCGIWMVSYGGKNINVWRTSLQGCTFGASLRVTYGASTRRFAKCASSLGFGRIHSGNLR